MSQSPRKKFGLFATPRYFSRHHRSHEQANAIALPRLFCGRNRSRDRRERMCDDARFTVKDESCPAHQGRCSRIDHTQSAILAYADSSSDKANQVNHLVLIRLRLDAMSLWSRHRRPPTVSSTWKQYVSTQHQESLQCSIRIIQWGIIYYFIICTVNPYLFLSTLLSVNSQKFRTLDKL